MTPRLRFFVFSLLALAAAAVAPLALADGAVATPVPSLDQFLASLAAGDEVAPAPACTAPAFDAAPTAELELACSCIDQCFRDRDCDFRCGLGQGRCVMVNSCCRECVCLATSAA